MESDKAEITAVLQTYGYKLLHKRRHNKDEAPGGGVGVILNMSLALTLISVYRLQFVPTNTFLDEFTELLEILCTGNDIFVLTGDVNIHLDTDESNAHRLRDIFLMFNMKQYVNFPTHKLGHTLDIVLTRVDSPSISDLYPNNAELSYHF